MKFYIIAKEKSPKERQLELELIKFLLIFCEVATNL